MYYCDYLVERETSYLKITANLFLDFQHSDNELVVLGTPKWWDDYVISKINLCEFDIYFLCACTVSHGEYNRLTDYKKVWGLHKIEKGFYDNYYENAKGRVYFGILKGVEQPALNYIGSSTILLLPKTFKLDENKIFNIFRDHKFDFSETKISKLQALAEVSMLYDGSILLKYNSREEISLTIFSNRLEGWFTEDVLSSYEGANETVHQKF